MPQVTLYLDEETDIKARLAAHSAGLSYSRWVADLIRSRTRDEWPESVRRLAGSITDFPTRTSNNARDIDRVPFD